MAKQTIGEFLQTLRKDKGLTQQEVADKLNVSNRTLSSWETDRTAPDLIMLPAIADLYGVTIDEILRGERRQATQPAAAETVNETQPDDRDANFNRRLLRFTVLAILSALTVFVGCVIMLHSPAPIWLDVLLMVIGIAGNAVFIACILRREHLALSDAGEDGKAYALAVKHRSSICLIINSLAYIAGAIILFISYYAGPAYPNVDGGVEVFYEANVAIAVSVCAVVGAALLAAGIVRNAVCVSCLGNACQRASLCANSRLIRKISLFGMIPVALCFIPYIVLSHVTFTKVEHTYFTANGVDEVYKKFQTLTLTSDKVLTDSSHDKTDITVIPEGEYYLDFKSTTYVTASDNFSYGFYYPEQIRLYDIGNKFYSTCNYESFSTVYRVGVYYLKDGVKPEDIDPETDFHNYFVFFDWKEVIKFTTPDGEQTAAAVAPYFFERDGWQYDYDAFYNLDDELVLTRDGENYTYRLIDHLDYSPLMLYVFGGVTAATAVTCTVIHLFKRKKIKYVI